MGRGLIGHFTDMARNNAWANDRLLSACVALGADEFAAFRTGFFPSLMATLNHVIMVDRYYLDALEEGGLGRDVFSTWATIESPAALRSAQAGSDARLIAFCEGLGPERLEARVVTDRGPKGRVTERRDAILAHLFQHQIHHRGQAHAMLSGTKVAPPQLDDFFLDYERAPSVAAMGLLPGVAGARGFAD